MHPGGIEVVLRVAADGVASLRDDLPAWHERRPDDRRWSAIEGLQRLDYEVTKTDQLDDLLAELEREAKFPDRVVLLSEKGSEALGRYCVGWGDIGEPRELLDELIRFEVIRD